mgnify:CR=1 FL=1
MSRVLSESTVARPVWSVATVVSPKTEMAKYLEELGYDVQEAQVPGAKGYVGAAGAGGKV